MTTIPGQTGFGTTLGYSLTLVSPTYTLIGNIKDIDGPDTEVGKVERTTLASTVKPYNATLPENTATFTVYHITSDPAVVALRAAMASAPVPTLAWEVTYPDGGADTFQGFPTSYKVSGIENETMIVADIGIQINTPIASTASTTETG